MEFDQNEYLIMNCDVDYIFETKYTPFLFRQCAMDQMMPKNNQYSKCNNLK